MSRRAALFDLDGTLVESGPGIMAAVRRTMQALGRPLDPAEDLSWVVGPPLTDVFARLLAPTADPRLEEAMLRYRADWDAHGLPESRAFHGIPAALEAFRADGWALFVATSKPRPVALRVLAHVGLADLFGAIYGPPEDGSPLAHKPELIAHVLDREGLAAGHTVMLGDRSFDISGAHANKLRAVGVLWGYGGPAELEQAGADAIAASPAELLQAAAGLLHGGVQK
jgi:phosphoglycolate phosphatase